jgi:two-component system NtrC family sensor kinase
MRALKASFLLIGPWESRLQELGAHIASDLQQAWHWIQDSRYGVVALPVSVILGKKFAEFYEEVKRLSPATQLIAVIPKDFSVHQMAFLHEEFSFFRVMCNFNDSDLEAHLFAALEESNKYKQNEELELLIREQTAQLKKLQIELEDRVSKRTGYLKEARRKLFNTNLRIEGFRRALMAVHQASTITEIEQFLNESLASTVQTSWIRVFYSPQDSLFEKQVREQLHFTQLQAPLFNHHTKIAAIFFLRPPNHPFNREEQDFLNRVAEAVALALDRIQKLQESESSKERWDATFNAMSDPVLLIDTNYEILQSNRALEDRLQNQSHKQTNRKCYQVLFQKDEPCPGCQRGRNFRIQGPDSGSRAFETYSQSLTLDPEKPPVFLNLYHDITEQLKMEKQILESAKMAELGTIGSSIAHELNNPLGGILSFTQLIKMEMKPENPIYPDILEMEAGVLRCKDIIENLLGFTRNPNADKNGKVSIKEVCLRALKIVELQTKSLSIEVHLSFPEEDLHILGHLNMLAQGLKNLLQASIERVTKKIRLQKGFRGQLYLEIFATPDSAHILIKDNGEEEKYSSHPLGLGISVAQQIINDHKANLEFFSDSTRGNMAKISFSRLVLRS